MVLDFSGDRVRIELDDVMSPLNNGDKLKFNKLYTQLTKIKIPDFKDEDAIEMGVKVKEGIEIIKKAIKQVSIIIK